MNRTTTTEEDRDTKAGPSGLGADRPQPRQPDRLKKPQLEQALRILARIGAIIGQCSKSPAEHRFEPRRYRDKLAPDLTRQSRWDNIIAILGGRGSGKSTTMLSVLDWVGQGATLSTTCRESRNSGKCSSEPESRKEYLLRLSSDEGVCEQVAMALDSVQIVPEPIDPEMFNGNAQFILSWVFAGLEDLVGLLVRELDDERCEGRGHGEFGTGATETVKPKLTLEARSEALREALSLIGGDYRQQVAQFTSTTDHFVQEVYRLQKSGLVLRKRIQEFFDALFAAIDARESDRRRSKSQPKKVLVISFDDIDMCEHQAAILLHMIHAYLVHPRVVILIAGDRSQFWWAVFQDRLKYVADRGHAGLSQLGSEAADHYHHLAHQVIQKFIREENVFTIEVDPCSKRLTDILTKIDEAASSGPHGSVPVLVGQREGSSEPGDRLRIGALLVPYQLAPGLSSAPAAGSESRAKGAHSDHRADSAAASEGGGTTCDMKSFPELQPHFVGLLTGNLRHIEAVRHLFGELQRRVESPGSGTGKEDREAPKPVLNWVLVERLREIFVAWSPTPAFREHFDRVVSIDSINDAIRIDILELADLLSSKPEERTRDVALVVCFLADLLLLFERYFPGRNARLVLMQDRDSRRRVSRNVFFSRIWPELGDDEIPDLELWLHSSLVARLSRCVAVRLAGEVIDDSGSNPALIDALVNGRDASIRRISCLLQRCSILVAMAQVAWRQRPAAGEDAAQPAKEFDPGLLEGVMECDVSVAFLAEAFASTWFDDSIVVDENELRRAAGSNQLGITFDVDKLDELRRFMDRVIPGLDDERLLRILVAVRDGWAQEVTKMERASLLKRRHALRNAEGSLRLTERGEVVLRNLLAADSR